MSYFIQSNFIFLRGLNDNSPNCVYYLVRFIYNIQLRINKINTL